MGAILYLRVAATLGYSVAYVFAQIRLHARFLSMYNTRYPTIEGCYGFWIETPNQVGDYNNNFDGSAGVHTVPSQLIHVSLSEF